MNSSTNERNRQMLTQQSTARLDHLTSEEMADGLGVSRDKLFKWRKIGLIEAGSPWSRHWLSEQAPVARNSYLELIHELIDIALELHGDGFVQSYLRGRRPALFGAPTNPATTNGDDNGTL